MSVTKKAQNADELKEWKIQNWTTLKKCNTENCYGTKEEKTVSVTDAEKY